MKIAHDGKAGIALARSFRPEVVLLDIGLPGMIGYEVVRAFRELPELHGLRLIAVSGYGQEADRIRSRIEANPGQCFNLGASAGRWR